MGSFVSISESVNMESIKRYLPSNVLSSSEADSSWDDSELDSSELDIVFRKVSRDFLRYYNHIVYISKTDIIMYTSLYNNPRKKFVMEFTIYTKLYIFQ